MNLKSLFISLFLLIAGISLAQSGKDECIRGKIERFNRLQKFKNINYPGDSKYDVKYYKLDLNVNHIAQTISGNVTCKGEIVEPNVTEIYYDLTNSLIVDSVLINGNAATFSRGSNKLNISLNTALNQGYNFTTVVYYHGTPGSSGFGSFEFSSHSGIPAIWTLSEPYGAMDWWPVKDTPADKADSADVWITVSTSLTPVSNGKLMEIVNNGNGTHTYKWKNSYPIAQYLLSMAITNYAQYTNYYHYSPTDSMPIDHFLYPESLNSNISQLNKTPGMIEIYSQQFGQYPFINEKYGHAQFGWGGGMEHQTISSMGGFSDGLISHELAHMWFGDKITCKDWHHIWLNEGFATYSEILYREMKYGKSVYDSLIAYRMRRALNATGSIWVQNASDIYEILNPFRSYSKGACVLHMLRGIVGDETFFNILYTYANDPVLSYGVATTEDFQEIAEEVYGQSLDYFFQEWIYGENYPEYTVNWGTTLVDDNTYKIDMNITQEMNSDPQFFTMPVQIKVYTNSGDTTITVFNNSQSQDFQFEVTGKPDSIVFDPGNWILKKVEDIINDVNDPSVTDRFSLSQNYPNPFNPITNIGFRIANLPDSKAGFGFVSLKVYDVLGREVATLVNEEKPAGEYEVEFDASGIVNLASGIYFYKLQAGSFSDTKKFILIK